MLRFPFSPLKVAGRGPGRLHFSILSSIFLTLTFQGDIYNHLLFRFFSWIDVYIVILSEPDPSYSVNRLLRLTLTLNLRSLK